MKKYARVALGVFLLTAAGIGRGQGTLPAAPRPSDAPVPEKIPIAPRPDNKPLALDFQIVGPPGQFPHLATYDNAGKPIPWVPGTFAPGAFGGGAFGRGGFGGGNQFGAGGFGGGTPFAGRDSTIGPGPGLQLLLDAVASKKKK